MQPHSVVHQPLENIAKIIINVIIEIVDIFALSRFLHCPQIIISIAITIIKV